MMEHSQFEGQLASKLHLENEADRDPMMATRIGRFDAADTVELLKPNPAAYTAERPLFLDSFFGIHSI